MCYYTDMIQACIKLQGNVIKLVKPEGITDFQFYTQIKQMTSNQKCEVEFTEMTNERQYTEGNRAVL